MTLSRGARAAGIALGVALLAGCATDEAALPQPLPQPLPLDLPIAEPSPADRTEVTAAAASPTPAAPAPPPEPAYPEITSLEGRSAVDLEALLGSPQFLRRDAPAEYWQYRGDACVLDLILYPAAGNALAVDYLDVRDVAD